MTREISAAEFISGRCTVKSVIGEGINAHDRVESGLSILSENIAIVFADGGCRKFHKEDKFSLDFIHEEVKAQIDFLNTGSHLRPVYSPPSGHINKEKTQNPSTIFIFNLGSVVRGAAQLPFYLYINDSVRDPRHNHARILARKVQIKVNDSEILEFDKDKATIEEVLGICEKAFKEEKLKSDKTLCESSEASGYKRKHIDGTLEYDLIDILKGTATLPVQIQAHYERISEEVVINIGDRNYVYSKWSLLDDVMTWRNDLSLRDTPPHGFIQNPEWRGLPKTFRIDDLFVHKSTLPVVKGYLLSEDVIVLFEDGSEKLYERNYLVKEILIELLTLASMASATERGYKNPLGGMIYDRIIVRDRIGDDHSDKTPLDENILIGFKDHVRSVVVLKNLTTHGAVAERFNDIIEESDKIKQKVFFARKK